MSVYYRFTAWTPYAGTEDEFCCEFDKPLTEQELKEMLEEHIQTTAEGYEYLATGWDGDFEDEEERNNYYADCDGEWEEITEEEYISEVGE